MTSSPQLTPPAFHCLVKVPVELVDIQTLALSTNAVEDIGPTLAAYLRSPWMTANAIELPEILTSTAILEDYIPASTDLAIGKTDSYSYHHCITNLAIAGDAFIASSNTTADEALQGSNNGTGLMALQVSTAGLFDAGVDMQIQGEYSGMI